MQHLIYIYISTTTKKNKKQNIQPKNKNTTKQTTHNLSSSLKITQSPEAASTNKHVVVSDYKLTEKCQREEEKLNDDSS